MAIATSKSLWIVRMYHALQALTKKVKINGVTVWFYNKSRFILFRGEFKERILVHCIHVLKNYLTSMRSLHWKSYLRTHTITAFALRTTRSSHFIHGQM